MVSSHKNILNGIKNYCKNYDVLMKYLVEIISDLKVIPMIRGKSFEYSTSDRLKEELSDRWEVKNLNINAQPNIHDIDVLVIRKKDNKQIRVECKLTKNNSFIINNDIAKIRVKCMRSRTFSDNASAERMAKNYKVSKEALLIHADSYRKEDFNFVITSLGNSMWKTINNKYVFNGYKKYFDFLKNKFPNHFNNFHNFQQETFNFLLFAKASDIAVSTMNNLKCTRKKCKNNGTDKNCGFIPNYPIINLNDVEKNKGPWKMIKYIETEFNNFLT